MLGMTMKPTIVQQLLIIATVSCIVFLAGRELQDLFQVRHARGSRRPQVCESDACGRH